MAILYVASTQPLAGKSAFCVGLARRMRDAGRRIGYMKPVSSDAHLAPGEIDEDAQFFKKALDLPDALKDMVPVSLRPGMLEELLLGEGGTDFAEELRTAYARVAAGRDLVLLEGGSNLREGALVELAPPQVSDLLGAHEVLVIKYESDQQLLDDALIGRARFGSSFIGAVLNSVPRPQMRFAEEVAKPALEKRGIPVLAVLPQERLLQSVTVAELATSLSGEILCCRDKTDELVEHVMVGAMSAASALSYFRLKPNKAVITGWDRSDIQYAALETSTKCLILTGNMEPAGGIRARAQEVGVPLILARQDTMAAAETVERAFGKTRCHHAKKIERFEEMLVDRLDLERLGAALAL